MQKQHQQRASMSLNSRMNLSTRKLRTFSKGQQPYPWSDLQHVWSDKQWHKSCWATRRFISRLRRILAGCFVDQGRTSDSLMQETWAVSHR